MIEQAINTLFEPELAKRAITGLVILAVFMIVIGIDELIPYKDKPGLVAKHIKPVGTPLSEQIGDVNSGKSSLPFVEDTQ